MKHKFALKTLAIAAVFAICQSFGYVSDPVEAKGCKFTDDITDYCQLTGIKVLNCVNNTATSDCYYDAPTRPTSTLE